MLTYTFRDIGRRPPKLHQDGSVAFADIEIAGVRVPIRSSILSQDRPVFQIAAKSITAENELAEQTLARALGHARVEPLELA